MTKIMSWNIEKFDKAKITSDPNQRFLNWEQAVSAAVTPTTPLEFLQLATDNCLSTAYAGITLPPGFTELFDYVIGAGIPTIGSGGPGVVGQAIAALAAASTPPTTFVTNYDTYLGAYPSPPPVPLPDLQPKLNKLKGILKNKLLKSPPDNIEVVVKVVFETYTTIEHNVKSNVPMGTHDQDKLPFYVLLALASELVNPTAATVASMKAIMQRTISTFQTVSTELCVFNHIGNNISPTNPTTPALLPDILVVFEVLSGTNVPRYTPIDGAGAEGIMLLLNQLRTFNSAYCLVPPVRLAADVTGAKNQDLESIAIFYNSMKLQFQGPNIWNGTNSYVPSAATATDTPSNNYGHIFSPPSPGVLPAGVNSYALPNKVLGTSIGTGASVATNENQLAGQANFTPLMFTKNEYRPPVLTQFQEYKSGDTAGNPTGRIIKLCAMHPNKGSGGANAPLAVAEIAKISEITTIGANEVGVIAGDFNVQLSDPTQKSAAYTGLISTHGYTLIFNDSGTAAPNKYIGTMLAGKTLLNGTFPTYGYILSLAPTGAPVDITAATPILPSSLDNILVKHGTPPATNIYSNAMILNRVVGVNSANSTSFPTPTAAGFVYGYDTIASISTATSPYGYSMSATIEQIRNPSGTAPPPAQVKGTSENSQMNALSNYGQIKETSDHLALVVEI